MGYFRLRLCLSLSLSVGDFLSEKGAKLKLEIRACTCTSVHLVEQQKANKDEIRATEKRETAYSKDITKPLQLLTESICLLCIKFEFFSKFQY